MHEQVARALDEGNHKEGGESRLEELVARYESPVRAVTHHLLERFVQAEFDEFIGPRPGAEVSRLSDGPTVTEYRNGHRTVKQFMAETLPLEDFRIPRSRAGGFRSRILGTSKKRAGRFALLAKELFVHGLGMRRVRRAFERAAINVSGLSRSSVARISEELRQECLKWSNRPISGKFDYLQLDAVYIQIRRKSPRKPGTLMFVGIWPNGRKEVLHSPSEQKARETWTRHWRTET